MNNKRQILNCIVLVARKKKEFQAEKTLSITLILAHRGCVTAVQFILFNFVNYSPSIAMKLKVSKELHVNNKIRDRRQTNLSPEHYF